MKIRLPLLFLFWLFTAVDLFGQAAPSQSTMPSVDSYEALVSRLIRGDTKIDYAALRLAYSRSKSADPYGADHEVRRQMNAAVVEKRCDEAMKIADTLLASFYLSPETHAAKSACYLATGDNAKADLHKAIYVGLINSILAKGDGNSPETAYSVITIEEEYAVMRALGFTVWGQEFVHTPEHTFNVLSGTDDRNKRSAKVYFNVDIPLAVEKQRRAAKP
jgi:hypothetical protein